MAKKNISALIPLLLLGVLVFFGCKKYEDGPGFTLRFKNTRIANDWVFEKLTIDGVDYTSEVDYLNSGIYISFSKGGDYRIVDDSTDFDDNGVWVFENKSRKKYISVQRDNLFYDVDFYITELKEDHMAYYYDEIHPDKKKGRYEVTLVPMTKYLRDHVRGE